MKLNNNNAKEQDKFVGAELCHNKSICSPTPNWRQARYQSKLKLQVGLLGWKEFLCVSIWKDGIPHISQPPNYFVTLSKIKERRIFSWRPSAFSDDVTITYYLFIIRK